jgi:hypothetical protein
MVCECLCDRIDEYRLPCSTVTYDEIQQLFLRSWACVYFLRKSLSEGLGHYLLVNICCSIIS